MIFNIQRETLLHPLSEIYGVIEKKQTLSILANFCIKAYANSLSITASDSEVEIVSTCQADIIKEGETTVSARKFFDICRSLADGSIMHVSAENNKCLIQSGKSKFSLATLSASDFPLIENIEVYDSFTVEAELLKKIITQSSFCMAVADVRYFLNGLLLEIENNKIRCVAADGHRLALSEAQIDNTENINKQFLIPRKGVAEIQKLIREKTQSVTINMGKNHINFICDGISLTSKLIDGNFPDYRAVIPLNMEKSLITDKNLLKSALQRAAILSSDKFKGVKIHISHNSMTIIGYNPEHEQAEDIIDIQSQIDDIKTGFNVSYLIDAVNAIDGDMIMFSFKDAYSSCLIKQPEENNCRLVVMPIRI